MSRSHRRQYSCLHRCLETAGACLRLQPQRLLRVLVCTVLSLSCVLLALTQEVGAVRDYYVAEVLRNTTASLSWISPSPSPSPFPPTTSPTTTSAQIATPMPALAPTPTPTPMPMPVAAPVAGDDQRQQSRNQTSPHHDYHHQLLQRGVECLRLTNASIALEYPADAEAHFEELHEQLADLRQHARLYFLKKTKNPYHCGEGYCGPWVENFWIARCNRTWQERAPGTTLHDLFGPYIPLLFTFVDLWSANVFLYEALILNLTRLLRPTVPYVAVVQHDMGLVSGRQKVQKVMQLLPNVLVFSAGGYGHIPVPLLKQPHQLLSLRYGHTPIKERKYFCVYLGSPGNGPRAGRPRMIANMTSAAQRLGVQDRIFLGKSQGGRWQQLFGASKVSLCPRGVGRTSFLLSEMVQMGLVPVHLYVDVPWVPYAELFESFGFVVNVSDSEAFLEALVKQNESVSDEVLERKARRVREVRETHFNYEAVVEQILRFLTIPPGREGGSDLRCQRLPRSTC